jgi:transcriptional regulator with PAS, ATPase and Fis domain
LSFQKNHSKSLVCVLKGNEMRSTHKHSTDSHDKTSSRFVNVKALLPERKGSRYRRLEDVDKLTTECQASFGDQASEPARTMRAEIERVARRPHNILITGETGTGKTHAAREIHRRSVRANKPFMELNCANLPEQLVEAELFGYCKGAFTGADRDRMGLFEEANGGILFLDEIGDIAPSVQNRLLKVIDEKQIKRLGTNHYIFCDVQIIAATSRNLPLMIHNGEFREDLYCRLAVLKFETIPLRDRREDIPAMVEVFLREAADAVAKSANHRVAYRIEEESLASLCEFDYPGNIRALRNLIYELTSYLADNEQNSIQLVRFSLNRLHARGGNPVIPTIGNPRGFPDARKAFPLGCPKNIRFSGQHADLGSIVNDGDIILPLEVCVLRRGETFNQWVKRAKHCSIEAARHASGGTLSAAAEQLGLTQSSLKSYLRRARRAQKEALFEWQRESE